MIEDALLHHPVDERLAVGGGVDFPGGRRGGHYEHHAGLRHRAHSGNRPPHGGRRPKLSHPPAIPRRGGGVVPRRRRDGNSPGPGHVDPCKVEGRTGPRRRRYRRSSPPWRSPLALASPSASIPPGKPRGWTPSKPCGTNDPWRTSRDVLSPNARRFSIGVNRPPNRRDKPGGSPFILHPSSFILHPSSFLPPSPFRPPPSALFSYPGQGSVSSHRTRFKRRNQTCNRPAWANRSRGRSRLSE